MAEPREPALDDEALDALVRGAVPEEAAPAGFAERALARRRRARARWPAILGTAALAASVAAAVVLTRGGVLDDAPGSGALAAATRETRELGRGTVVAEPGAVLSWNVAGDGAVQVTQQAGRAFYRVDRGESAFVVDTPAGRVVVHGTCFTVTVDPGARPQGARGIHPSPQEPAMSNLALSSRLPSAAAGAVLGAALSAAVVVSVQEGRVSLENEHGAVAVAAGEEARAERGTAPRASAPPADALARTAAALARAEQALEATRAASDGDVGALVAENARLRAELTDERASLQVMKAERVEDRGEALPFPEDLPPRFSEQGLLKSFQQAFADGAVKGEVSSIDCTEYPCIVYGKVQGDTRDLMKELQKSASFKDYAEDRQAVSGWTRGDDGPEEFAVVLTPKPAEGDDEAERSQAGRRVRWRIDQGRAGSR